jgi:3-oxoacyl-[acyl-carrier protein] reductase
MTALKGKRALITGGSRGIGAAIAKRLAKDGADIAFTYVSQPARAKETTDAVRASGVRVLGIQADSANATELVAAVDRAAAEFGGLDILVNSAGIAPFAPIDTMSLEDFDRTFAINVRAVFIATQAAVKHMQSGGRIVNISSCNAERMPFPGGATYAMSKAALTGLAKGLARDLGARGITINNVQPGPVDTDMNPASGPFAETLKSLLAIPRYASGDEIAAMVAYLVGPDTGMITGASLTIDGGFTA